LGSQYEGHVEVTTITYQGRNGKFEYEEQCETTVLITGEEGRHAWQVATARKKTGDLIRKQSRLAPLRRGALEGRRRGRRCVGPECAKGGCRESLQQGTNEERNPLAGVLTKTRTTSLKKWEKSDTNFKMEQVVRGWENIQPGVQGPGGDAS